MNVRGCGRVEKQDLIERMITETGFDIWAFSETKLKGSGEFMMYIIKGVKAGVGERCRAREGVVERWSGYFESLLNVEDDRKANLTSMGRGCVTSKKVGEQTDFENDEVHRAVSMLKNGKAAGEDGITNEMVKGGGLVIVECLVRLFNVCMNIGNAPEDWRSAIVVLLLKGNGDKKECKKYRCISLLSTPGKLYGRVLIERVSELTEVHI
jgi:hypothetical protein